MIFVCPDCRTSLESTYTPNILNCSKCESDYEIKISINKILGNVKELDVGSSEKSDSVPSTSDTNRI